MTMRADQCIRGWGVCHHYDFQAASKDFPSDIPWLVKSRTSNMGDEQPTLEMQCLRYDQHVYGFSRYVYSRGAPFFYEHYLLPKETDLSQALAQAGGLLSFSGYCGIDAFMGLDKQGQPAKLLIDPLDIALEAHGEAMEIEDGERGMFYEMAVHLWRNSYYRLTGKAAEPFAVIVPSDPGEADYQAGVRFVRQKLLPNMPAAARGLVSLVVGAAWQNRFHYEPAACFILRGGVNGAQAEAWYDFRNKTFQNALNPYEKQLARLLASGGWPLWHQAFIKRFGHGHITADYLLVLGLMQAQALLARGERTQETCDKLRGLYELLDRHALCIQELADVSLRRDMLLPLETAYVRLRLELGGAYLESAADYIAAVQSACTLEAGGELGLLYAKALPMPSCLSDRDGLSIQALMRETQWIARELAFFCPLLLAGMSAHPKEAASEPFLSALAACACALPEPARELLLRAVEDSLCGMLKQSNDVRVTGHVMRFASQCAFDSPALTEQVHASLSALKLSGLPEEVFPVYRDFLRGMDMKARGAAVWLYETMEAGPDAARQMQSLLEFVQDHINPQNHPRWQEAVAQKMRSMLAEHIGRVDGFADYLRMRENWPAFHGVAWETAISQYPLAAELLLEAFRRAADACGMDQLAALYDAARPGRDEWEKRTAMFLTQYVTQNADALYQRCGSAVQALALARLMDEMKSRAPVIEQTQAYQALEWLAGLCGAIDTDSRSGLLRFLDEQCQGGFSGSGHLLALARQRLILPQTMPGRMAGALALSLARFGWRPGADNADMWQTALVFTYPGFGDSALDRIRRHVFAKNEEVGCLLSFRPLLHEGGGKALTVDAYDAFLRAAYPAQFRRILRAGM